MLLRLGGRTQLMLDTSHEDPPSTSMDSDPSRTKHLHDDDNDEEDNNELAQEIEGEKQQTQWLWRAPVVTFGLTLLVVSAILPHSFGIIFSSLFLLLLLLDSYFVSMFRQKKTLKKMKIIRFLFRFLLYCLGAYCFILLILSMIGLAPNAFSKQFPTLCLYPHANNCALLCDSSNKTTTISSSSKVFNVERSDGGILSMKFTCNGNHRVASKLSTPWMNATSILQASEVVQHAMLASNVWVDSIQEVTDNGQNEAVMSSSGKTSGKKKKKNLVFPLSLFSS